MPDTSEFEAMERNGWSDPGIANSYARGFDNATRLVARALSDSIGAAPHMRVLDLCCGHGVVAASLAERGADVTGLDFSPAMVALARKAVPDATITQGDAMGMEFADASFDAVTIGFGVPHFPDPAKGLAEAARVLRPGGRLAFSIWQGKGSAGAFGWLFEAVADLGDPTAKLPEGPDAHAFADLDVAGPALKAAGFRQIVRTDVASESRLSSPDDLFDTFDQGAVRAAALLGAQPEQRRNAIRDALSAQLRKNGRRVGGMWHAPMPSVVVSAVRR